MIPNLALMLATIGSLVALYVLVRSVQVVEGGGGAGLKILAAMTAIASLVAIVVLVLLAVEIVNAGLDVGEQLRGLSRPIQPSPRGAPRASIVERVNCSLALRHDL